MTVYRSSTLFEQQQTTTNQQQQQQQQQHQEQQQQRIGLLQEPQGDEDEDSDSNEESNDYKKFEFEQWNELMRQRRSKSNSAKMNSNNQNKNNLVNSNHNAAPAVVLEIPSSSVSSKTIPTATTTSIQTLSAIPIAENKNLASATKALTSNNSSSSTERNPNNSNNQRGLIRSSSSSSSLSIVAKPSLSLRSILEQQQQRDAGAFRQQRRERRRAQRREQRQQAAAAATEQQQQESSDSDSDSDDDGSTSSSSSDDSSILVDDLISNFEEESNYSSSASSFMSQTGAPMVAGGLPGSSTNSNNTNMNDSKTLFLLREVQLYSDEKSLDGEEDIDGMESSSSSDSNSFFSPSKPVLVALSSSSSLLQRQMSSSSQSSFKDMIRGQQPQQQEQEQRRHQRRSSSNTFASSGSKDKKKTRHHHQYRFSNFSSTSALQSSFPNALSLNNSVGSCLEFIDNDDSHSFAESSVSSCSVEGGGREGRGISSKNTRVNTAANSGTASSSSFLGGGDQLDGDPSDETNISESDTFAQSPIPQTAFLRDISGRGLQQALLSSSLAGPTGTEEGGWDPSSSTEETDLGDDDVNYVMPNRMSNMALSLPLLPSSSSSSSLLMSYSCPSAVAAVENDDDDTHQRRNTASRAPSLSLRELMEEEQHQTLRFQTQLMEQQMLHPSPSKQLSFGGGNCGGSGAGPACKQLLMTPSCSDSAATKTTWALSASTLSTQYSFGAYGGSINNNNASFTSACGGYTNGLSFTNHMANIIGFPFLTNQNNDNTPRGILGIPEDPEVVQIVIESDHAASPESAFSEQPYVVMRLQQEREHARAIRLEDAMRSRSSSKSSSGGGDGATNSSLKSVKDRRAARKKKIPKCRWDSVATVSTPAAQQVIEQPITLATSSSGSSSDGGCGGEEHATNLLSPSSSSDGDMGEEPSNRPCLHRQRSRSWSPGRRAVTQPSSSRATAAATSILLPPQRHDSGNCSLLALHHQQHGVGAADDCCLDEYDYEDEVGPGAGWHQQRSNSADNCMDYFFQEQQQHHSASTIPLPMPCYTRSRSLGHLEMPIRRRRGSKRQSGNNNSNNDCYSNANFHASDSGGNSYDYTDYNNGGTGTYFPSSRQCHEHPHGTTNDHALANRQLLLPFPFPAYSPVMNANANAVNHPFAGGGGGSGVTTTFCSSYEEEGLLTSPSRRRCSTTCTTMNLKSPPVTPGSCFELKRPERKSSGQLLGDLLHELTLVVSEEEEDDEDNNNNNNSHDETTDE